MQDDSGCMHGKAAQDSGDYNFLFNEEEIRKHTEEFIGKLRNSPILSDAEIDSLMAALAKEKLFEAVSREEAEEKRTAAFSLTWVSLSRASKSLCAAMWEMWKSGDILAQARLIDHIKTVDTLLSQDPKSEQFTGGNEVGNNAKLFADACKARRWAEVEHYIDVFKTAFKI